MIIISSYNDYINIFSFVVYQYSLKFRVSVNKILSDIASQLETIVKTYICMCEFALNIHEAACLFTNFLMYVGKALLLGSVFPVRCQTSF